MGEIRTMNVAAVGSIYDPDTINDALRSTMREIQTWMGLTALRARTDISRVAGFQMSASEVGPDITVGITPGVGMKYAAGVALPASKWSWVYSEVALSVAAFQRHATLPRIDLFSLSWTTPLDTEVNVGFEGDIPDDVMTQRGSLPVLVRTAGTPNASPTAPALPAGHLLIGEVLVPESGGDPVTITQQTHAWFGPDRFWKTVPWFVAVNDYAFGTFADTPAVLDSKGIKISRTTDAAVELYTYLTIPVDGRGLEVVGCELLYDYDQLFDAPFVATTAELWVRKTSGDTKIAEVDLDAIGATAARAVATMYAPGGSPGDDIDETGLGDPESTADEFVCLFVRVAVTLADTNNTDGRLWLYGARVKLKEFGGLAAPLG